MNKIYLGGSVPTETCWKFFGKIIKEENKLTQKKEGVECPKCVAWVEKNGNGKGPNGHRIGKLSPVYGDLDGQVQIGASCDECGHFEKIPTYISP